MVPAAFVMLESLPLTANGKLDRKASAGPGEGCVCAAARTRPAGGDRGDAGGIWQELLGVERSVGSDNFFELGGHSLLVVQDAGAAARVGLRAEIRARVRQSDAGGAGGQI